MSRIYYDNSKYLVEKSKLPKPDGIHCVICGGDLPKHKRKYCSDECYWKWYGVLGVKDWNVLRFMVMNRDNHRCNSCGAEPKDKVLEVHHIRAIQDGGEEFNPDNCITLCRSCHKKKHSKLGKIISQHKTLEQYEEE